MSDEIITQSIKKLLSLKMSDDEIIGSLIDAGVDYNYAQTMLDNVKNNKPIEKTKDAPKLIAKKTDSKDTTSGNLWQQGILTVINEKLENISEKEKNIDKSINSKIEEYTNREVKKIKVMLDSQRTLLISKINTTLESKAEEIESRIDETLKNLETINKQTEEKLKELEAMQTKIKDFETSITQQMEEFAKLRDKSEDIISEIRADFDKKSQIIIEKYNSKFEEIDSKINGTMSLSSKIIEGLVEATKKKIDIAISEKTKESTTKAIEERIEKLVDKRIQKFTNSQKEIDQMKSNISDLEKKLSDKNKDSVVPKDIENRLDEFDTFKKQYAALTTKVIKDIKDLKKKKK